MNGDMRMWGGMTMDGQLSTVMKTDNTASKLGAVPVYGSQHSGAPGVVAPMAAVLAARSGA